MAKRLIFNPFTGTFDWYNDAAGGAANAFSTMQTDQGTSPVADSATDTLTFTSSDSTILITGDSITDTIDLQTNGWSGSFTNGDGDTVTVVNGIITNVA